MASPSPVPPASREEDVPSTSAPTTVTTILSTANASPMFGSGPSGSGFGGFPAIPSTSTAPSGLMLPNLPSTSAQAPDANTGISNDAYLSYLQQYAMLLNQQGAGNQGGLGTPGASGSAPGSSFLMLNQGPPPPQQLQQPSIPQPQPSLLSVFQAQQQHPQPLDYTALADAQQRRQSASFSSPAIHQAPPQQPNQQLTLNALQALQQAPNAAFLQALMPPPPQPQPQPPPSQQPLQQQLFSDEFLLSELQRELSRREAAVIQAQQQVQQIQAFQQAIQRGVITASQTQQLLALFQQQLRPQAPQPSSQPKPPVSPRKRTIASSSTREPDEKQPRTDDLGPQPTLRPSSDSVQRTIPTSGRRRSPSKILETALLPPMKKFETCLSLSLQNVCYQVYLFRTDTSGLNGVPYLAGRWRIDGKLLMSFFSGLRRAYKKPQISRRYCELCKIAVPGMYNHVLQDLHIHYLEKLFGYV
uniref:ARID domain-containing protein n=1 Tax=Panagrellus redivivus TaxID=6233 RepID=A0A7E4UPJ9_PANRE